jgi:hypothetical protein
LFTTKDKRNEYSWVPKLITLCKRIVVPWAILISRWMLLEKSAILEVDKEHVLKLFAFASHFFSFTYTYVHFNIHV